MESKQSEEDKYWKRYGTIDRRDELCQRLNDICWRASKGNLPMELTEVRFTSLLNDMEQLNANVFVSWKTESFTKEYKLLEKMMEKVVGSSVYEYTYPHFPDVIPVLIKECDKNADEREVKRLTEIYNEWLKRLSWRNFEITNRKKPSNASWDGLGYEFWRIIPRVLSHWEGIKVSLADFESDAIKIWSNGDNVLHSKEPGYQESEFYQNLKQKVIEQCSSIFKETSNAKKRYLEEMPEEDKDLSSWEQEKRRKLRVTNDEIDEIAESRESFRLFYQIKASIEGTPVWRMIVISGSVTFDNLHKILSIVFGYDDSTSYSFTTGEVTIIKGAKKVQGEKKSAASTKWCSVIKYPGDKITYNHGDWKIDIVVDKVNFSKRNSDIESTPRCVDGEYASTGKVVPSKYKAPKENKFEVDKINNKLFGKRFARNSAQNKVAKSGPRFFVPSDIDSYSLGRITMNCFAQKLV